MSQEMKMRPYVKHVKSNLKGGVDVELGYRTLIVGPNGSGKSAITNSLEYALTAKISDVVGRTTVADVNQLLTLGPGEAIFSEALLLEHEIEGLVRVETKGKKSTTALHPNAFPLREVRESLGGAVDTVRKFFLRMVAGKVTQEDVTNSLPGPYHKLFEEVIVGTPINTAAVDLLLHALSKASERKRDLASEAKTSTAIVTETTQGLQAISAGQIQAARAALVTARNEVIALRHGLANAQRIAECVTSADTASAEIDRLTEALAVIPAPAEADRVREHLVELLNFARMKGLGACPCCKQQERGEGQDEQKFTSAFWGERLVPVGAKHAERAAQLEEHTRLTRQIQQAKERHRQAEATLLAFSREDDAPAPGEEVPLYNTPDLIEVALADAKAREVTCEAEVIRLERGSSAWEQARRSRDIAAERTIQSTQWSGFEDALKETIGTLLDGAVTAFTEKVQHFLPPSDRFFLQLRDGEREICRYGFARSAEVQGDITGGAPDRYDSALSGAEWARLSAALASAYLGDSEALAVIIPDDRSWDPTSLGRVMRALEAAPAQVIIATTTEPLDPPSGWTVIRTGTEPAPIDLEAVERKGLADLEREAGDYISVGSCAHGISGAHCLDCRRDRETAERDRRNAAEKARAAKEVKEQKNQGPAADESTRKVPRKQRKIDKLLE